MPKLTFYPLGNADTALITLDRKFLLVDYANMRDPGNRDDKRIDLPPALKEDIGWPDRNRIEVVGFTHLDNDHTKGAGEFFWLDHAEAYQSKDRVKIDELWVPAAAIVEEGAEDDARVIRQEARHRLRKGYGIRVFSRPAHLKEWLEGEGLTLDSRLHLITDAGQIAPGFSKDADGVEIFIHSPFAERDGDVVLDRNEHSLVIQATFKAGDTRLLMAADTVADNWEWIVKITRRKGNESRLGWDIYKLPHHCSYLSLGEDKGKIETPTSANISWLLEQAGSRAMVISTSEPIDNEDSDQPPHFQAKNTYLRALRPGTGKFLTTMEHPNRSYPKRLIIEIGGAGGRVITTSVVGGGGLVSMPAPRVG